jgi:predicted component of type VI protein secretion system
MKKVVLMVAVLAAMFAGCSKKVDNNSTDANVTKVDVNFTTDANVTTADKNDTNASN